MRLLITTIIVVFISGCAANPPFESPPQQRPDVVRRHDPSRAVPEFPPQSGPLIARHALAMVGTPYRYGGASADTGFDCSGLVFYSYAQSGFAVPRTSTEQFRRARKISLSDAVAGDLLFFADQQKLSHVGIYVGERSFVHAPVSGRSVSVANLDDPWYQMHLVGVGRLLP